MKAQSTFTESHVGVIRAGVISLLVFALCYLWMTKISDLPGAWLFMVLFAVCFVLMIQAIVDLLVLAFASVARFSGMIIGRSVRVVRRLSSRATNTA